MGGGGCLLCSYLKHSRCRVQAHQRPTTRFVKSLLVVRESQSHGGASRLLYFGLGAVSEISALKSTCFGCQRFETNVSSGFPCYD
jgi:hypothetical protein